MGRYYALRGLGLDVGPGLPYTVQSGDGMTQITWKLGRAAAEVRDLYTVSPAAFTGPPNFSLKLNPGQVLVLPAGWPSKPVRTLPASNTWIREAAAVLKTMGYAGSGSGSGGGSGSGSGGSGGGAGNGSTGKRGGFQQAGAGGLFAVLALGLVVTWVLQKAGVGPKRNPIFGSPGTRTFEIRVRGSDKKLLDTFTQFAYAILQNASELAGWKKLLWDGRRGERAFSVTTYGSKKSISELVALAEGLGLRVTVKEIGVA